MATIPPDTICHICPEPAERTLIKTKKGAPTITMHLCLDHTMKVAGEWVESNPGCRFTEERCEQAAEKANTTKWNPEDWEKLDDLPDLWY